MASLMLTEPERGSVRHHGGKLLGAKQRMVCEERGGPMEGGEEVWTTDKETRGRAERKQRCMDTVRREGHGYDVYCG